MCLTANLKSDTTYLLIVYYFYFLFFMTVYMIKVQTFKFYSSTYRNASILMPYLPSPSITFPLVLFLILTLLVFLKHFGLHLNSESSLLPFSLHGTHPKQLHSSFIHFFQVSTYVFLSLKSILTTLYKHSNSYPQIYQTLATPYLSQQHLVTFSVLLHLFSSYVRI